MSPPFFITTGIENSYPTIASGARIDQMAKSGHYERWEEDFSLVRDLGVHTLRYGPPYYRAHVAPDRFEFEPWDAPMQRLRELGIECIADLCHFGVPPWLGGFQDDAFPVLFANYARHFALRYPWVRYFTPVNEIFVCANFSALQGWWNECERSEHSFARAIRNLCMAHELAVEAILEVRQDAIIVQGESIEHFHAAGSDAVVSADRLNEFKEIALDLTMGHELRPGIASFLMRHGVQSSDLSFFRQRRGVGQRWLGLDYYKSCEHRVCSTGRQTSSRKPMGLRAIGERYYRRYRIPLFHCETNCVSAIAVEWLNNQWDEVMGLRAAGIPVHGFTWYSLTDQVDWQYALRVEHNHVHPVGLYDMTRRLRPVGQRYREIVAGWKDQLAEEEQGQLRASA
ncbi:MAG: family 1 glycosylhydrolase [Gemmatimonadaceae bacterium]